MMDFEALRDFLNARMRMSHVYQPAMLETLLEQGGRATVREVALSLLSHDESQIEYYEQIARAMPGRVLQNHGVVEARRDGRRVAGYALPGFDELTEEQVAELRALCRAKIRDYVDRRGRAIWEHRTNAKGYVTGTLRYEVLKRAGFHCELCGVAADVKALEVDHIIPRVKGGTDEPSNLQALCYSCNAMKRDRDDTDFRAVRESYGHREAGCLFCEIPPERIIAENELAYVVRDGFPVTPLHSLIIPKRHAPTYFDLSQAEANAVTALLAATKGAVQEEDASVAGFNVGMNCGEAAGQSIAHCHVHLIPRREGDVANPRGGVRHVIPGKGDY